MSEGQKALEELIKTAYGVLRRLERNLEPGYTLTVSHEEQIVLEALQQHGDHIRVHQVEQKRLDAFKMVCWLGGSLLNAIEETDRQHQSPIIIDAVIQTLVELLILETRGELTMPRQTTVLLKSLLLQEMNGNPKHGIWMNGLYSSFHCCVATWRDREERTK